MENTNDINAAVKSLLRTADIMDAYSLKIAEASKSIEGSQKSVSNEVTLLRACNQEIENTIANSVSESAETFSEKTSKKVTSFLEKEIDQFSRIIKTLKQDQSQFLNVLKDENKRYKKKLSKAGSAIIFSFCLGSIVSGAGLWYFFPQTSIVQLNLNTEQRRQMEYGALIQLALPKMSQKEQDKIWSLMGHSWKDYYEKLFGRKLR